jgi:hypothetical protein
MKEARGNPQRLYQTAESAPDGQRRRCTSSSVRVKVYARTGRAAEMSAGLRRQDSAKVYAHTGRAAEMYE